MQVILRKSSLLKTIEPADTIHIKAMIKLMMSGKIIQIIALRYFAPKILPLLTGWLIVRRNVPASRSPAIAS